MPKNFDDIPQEKFDTMNDGMKKQLGTCKELKIKSIDIQDYKNIDYINTELGDINIIGGYNGNGKSSFVESIFVGIQGNVIFGKGKIQPAQLIKKGENKAIIKIIIAGKENEFIIERQFTKGTKAKPQGNSKLIATKNGEEIKQNELNEILKSVTIDPIAFGDLSINDQIQEIKNSTGLDTTDIDKEISDKEEDRKESNRYVKERATIYEEIIAPGIPEEVKKTSVSKLIEDRELVDQKNKKIQEMEDKKKSIMDTQEEIKTMQLDLKELESELEDIKFEGSKLHTKTLNLGTIKEIDNKISDIESVNKKAEKYEKYIEAKKDNKEATKDAEEENELLEKLREKRIKIIADSNLPDYMEISDLGILVDGIEYKLLNTARKIEVTIDLILISNSPLRTIRIENGGELDIKTLKEISDKIKKAGFQGFFERPMIDKYDSIIINEGDLLEGEEKDDFINKQ